MPYSRRMMRAIVTPKDASQPGSSANGASFGWFSGSHPQAERRIGGSWTVGRWATGGAAEFTSVIRLEYAVQQRGQWHERISVQRIANTGVLNLAHDDAGGLEDSQVLGHRGLGQSNLIDDVAANAGPLRQQHANDADARGMAKRLCDQRHVLITRIEIRCDRIRSSRRNHWHRTPHVRQSSINDR